MIACCGSRAIADYCKRCGRNLTALGQYRDYVHYVPGTQTPCLTIEEALGMTEEEFDEIINPLQEELARKLSETIDLLVKDFT